MKKILFLIVLLSFQNNFGQLVSEEFTSRILNGKRKIVTYLPDKFDKKEAYPLLVVLNAGSLLEPVISSARYFDHLESMPKTIIVGVYNEAEDVTADPQSSGVTPQMADFLNFIGGELVPYIQGKYILNSFKGIIANEEAGFLATHFSLGETPFFNAFILLNPMVHKYIYSSDNQPFKNSKTKLFHYIATSNLLDNPDAYENTKELDNTLKTNGLPENVTHYLEDFTGSSSEAVVLTGIARAFDLLFDSYRPISVKEFREKILPLGSDFVPYLTEKYAKIETELGIKKKPSINDIMAIYQASLQKEDWNSLSQLSDFVKDNGYSKTAMPNFFLGEFYEKTGDNKRAFRTYQKAYSEPSIDFINQKIINERLEKVKK